MNPFITVLPSVFRYLRSRSLLCVSLVLLFASTAFAQSFAAEKNEPLPKQEDALARALANHPEIVAAKAKVALAEAELYGKRMEVSRQVLERYGNLKRLQLSADVAKAELTTARAEVERAKAQQDAGSTYPPASVKVQTAEAELVQATSQREQVEKELRLLIGSAISPPFEAKASGKAFAAVARQTPQGPVVDNVKTALEKPIKFDFTEIPLVEVAAIVGAETKIPFSIQAQALEEAGLRPDEPISLITAEVPLRAAMQAFEDYIPQLQFILRDYGILITTKTYAESHAYVPVLEPVQESAANTTGPH